MEPMTLDEAKEILRNWTDYNDDRLIGEAKGFIEGWDARGKEVGELKDLLQSGMMRMKSINGADDGCITGDPNTCLNHSWIHVVEMKLANSK